MNLFPDNSQFNRDRNEAYNAFMRFMTLDSSSNELDFVRQMNYVDCMLQDLMHNYNYFPDWQKAFEDKCDTYFLPMRIKIREPHENFHMQVILKNPCSIN